MTIQSSTDLKRATMRNLHLFLLGFLGIGALGGGGVFIISPSGGLIGMPVSVLHNSPFNDFLIPGILLFTVIGMLPFILITSLIKKYANKAAEFFNFYKDMHWAWTFSIYQAFALIIWIQVQMVIMQAVHWLHTFYMFYAVLMIFISLLPGVRKFYKR